MGAALLFGQDLLTNPIFGFLYVWVWVGLVPISLLFGPVWRTLNPIRTLHLLLCRAAALNPTSGLLHLPRNVGIWPAAVGFFAFVWLELAAPDRATRLVVLFWLGGYITAMLIGGVVFGQRWFSVADPFEAYATIVAKLSPWARAADGRIAARAPLTNLATLSPKPGQTTLIAILLGSTGWDGFSNSSTLIVWAQDSNLPSPLINTLGLLAFIGIVIVSYQVVTRSIRIPDRPSRELPGLFAHTLVPIALGYVTAHYVTLLLFEGQRVFITSSDPLSRDWNLFGTAEFGVNYGLANYPGLIGLIQTGAIITGHILGVIAAHDRALVLQPRGRAVTGQIPMVALMVAYTTAGLLLLFSE